MILKMTPRHTFSAAAFVALVAAGTLVAVQHATAESSGKITAVGVGQPAPDFTLKDQDGKLVTLSEFKDKVVVLEWFNDGCPFVQKWYKNGDMNKLAADYQGKGVVWLAVNSTNSADAAHNKVAAAKYDVLRPILDDHDGEVGKRYAAQTTPQMYVINKGTLVYDGAIDSTVSTEPEDIAKSDNYVRAALDNVLADKPVEKAVTKSYGCSVKYK